MESVSISTSVIELPGQHLRHTLRLLHDLVVALQVSVKQSSVNQSVFTSRTEVFRVTPHISKTDS